MPTEIAVGPTTITSTSETNLEAARTAAAVDYVYEVDLSALAAGEVAIVRLYFILLASGTEEQADMTSYLAGSEPGKIVQVGPVPMQAATGVTIRCSVTMPGWTTNRSIPWILYSLSG